MDNNDITELFRQVISQAGSIDVAESEFKKMIGEDDDLHKAYRQWCHEVGSSERNGFLDYCEEYLDNQESIWDTLDNDYDK
ncbi:MAG: hypothetical protein K2L97_01305 [Muribaculaceae bacterium]|nr:hypothetical protein [Muribaculaceae bacterium]